MVSPFLREICKRTGCSEEQLVDRWHGVLDQIAHGRAMEDLTNEDYMTAQELLEAQVVREIEDDPLNPDKFLASNLDAESYLETTFVQDSPDGPEIEDDERTHLIAPGEGKALQGAGLMAPGGAVGESIEDGMLADDEIGDLEVGDVITIVPEERVGGEEAGEDELARLAAEAAEEALKRSPR